MSAQYRAELSKLAAKYARTFGIHESIVVCRDSRGEDLIHCPSRPDLPSWGTGSNGEDWQDGPAQPRVSRKKGRP